MLTSRRQVLLEFHLDHHKLSTAVCHFLEPISPTSTPPPGQEFFPRDGCFVLTKWELCWEKLLVVNAYYFFFLEKITG